MRILFIFVAQQFSEQRKIIVVDIKIDGCIGKSFLRSYATLTRSTDTSDVIQSYYGTTRIG